MQSQEATEYERHIVEIMRDSHLTLSEAMDYDFRNSNVDTSSAIGMCDYLEERLSDLNKVKYYMMIYTGQSPDLALRKI
jgi:hypothetical protein